MKRTLYTLLFTILLLNCKAQTAPVIVSWVRNLTGETGYNSIPSNVQSVEYDASNVYVAVTCIPGYSIGPWNGNPNTPVNQNFVYKITRNPVHNTGTHTTIGDGHTGVWSNGVSVFNVSDAQSYNNAGVWNRNAYYWEGSGFDNCLGHPNQSGEYHHHVNPKCLYDDQDSTRHSPIIGYAFDGYPIYGIFAYTNTNGTGPLKRMRSSYVLSTATTRTNGPAVSSSYPAGCFMEDYYYSAGSGDLDSSNGRFCVTPEYPSGTYCYFATIDSTSTPTFPYTMYKAYYGVVQSGNIGPSGGHNTAPGTDTLYTAAYVPTISISAGTNPVCSGSSVTFSVLVTNAGTNPVYVWKKNGITVYTGNTYSTSSFSNNDTITCMLTSNAYYLTADTATSNKVIMSVSQPVTPTVAVTSTATSICTGNPVTFTATPANGGATPAYQWKVNNTNAGTNSSVFTTSALTNGAVVTCVITSSASCALPASATSNSVTVSINGSAVPAVSINAQNINVCSGSTATFTATPTNGGNSPSYQWKIGGVNTGTDSVGYTTAALTAGTTVQCILTSSLSCASPASANSNTVTVAVNALPQTTINPSGNAAVCNGDSLLLTAAGGTGYHWSNNANTAAIWVKQQGTYNVTATNADNCSAAADTPADLTVNNAVIPTVTQSANALTSSSAVSYQWMLNGTNINGDTTQTIWPIQNGSYAVSVIDASGCTATSTLYAFAFTGLHEAGDIADLQLYPIPNTGSFIIEMPVPGESQLVIYDLCGKEIYQTLLTTTHQLINCTSLSPAVYLVHIISGGQTQVIKMMVI